MQFYDEIFKCINYGHIMTIKLPKKSIFAAGCGIPLKPIFWISPQGNASESIRSAKGVHFAFLLPNEDAVDSWYKTTITHGAKDNGKPGPRPEYHPSYYGAFVTDPNGWHLEAVYHEFTS